MVTKSKVGIFKSKVYNCQDQIIGTEPQSVKEALMNSSWKKAMQEEYNALIKNKG